MLEDLLLSRSSSKEEVEREGKNEEEVAMKNRTGMTKK
jgi:hypothetical protein